jgi:hypothetical protein
MAEFCRFVQQTWQGVQDGCRLARRYLLNDISEMATVITRSRVAVRVGCS